MAVNGKKLTDFFKPQEKPFSPPPKQKNILHFFSKNEGNDTTGSAEVKIDEEELLLSVNKENKSRSRKACAELNAEVISLLEDSTEELSQSSVKKKKKNKDKPLGQAETDQEDTSKQVSNASKKNDLINREKHVVSNKTSNLFIKSNNDSGLNKTGKNKEISKQVPNISKKSSKSVNQGSILDGITKADKGSEQDDVEIDLTRNIDEKEVHIKEISEGEFKHPKDVKSIKSGSKLRKSGSFSSHKEHTYQTDEQQNAPSETLRSNKPAKKNTLCGREMMSLLKEIKNAEEETSVKKKKHKHRKKHKTKDKVKEKEGLNNIQKDTAVSDYHEEQVNKMKSDSLTSKCDKDEISHETMDRTKTRIGKIRSPIHKKNSKKETVSIKKLEHGSYENPESSSDHNQKVKEISYEDFIKKLEDENEDMDVDDSNDNKNNEMSDDLGKKTVKDIQEEMDVEITCTTTETETKEKQSEKPKCKPNLTKSQFSGTGSIAKFFMTSTPDGKKKSDKNGVSLSDVCKISNVIDVNDSLNEFATPEPVKRGRKSKTKIETEVSAISVSVSDATSDEVVDTDNESENGERRRSQRKKYKVSVFQMDEDRCTPIKIKLKRCPASSSSIGETSEEKKTTLKAVKPTISKASELLKKAKKSKHKRSQKSKDEKILKEKITDNHSSRHSARLKDRKMPSMEEVSLDAIVLLSDEDELDEETKVKGKRGRPFGWRKDKSTQPSSLVAQTGEKKVAETVQDKKKTTKTLTATPKRLKVKKGSESPNKSGGATPKKTATPKSKTATPKKGTKSNLGSKIHPMFMIGKKPVENSPKKPVLSAEEMKQRQEFLMSGIPSELKKQSIARTVSCVLDYPPLPTVSHVLQAPVASDTSRPGVLWHLAPVELNIYPGRQIPSVVYPRGRFSGDLIKRYEKPFDASLLKTFVGHAPIEDQMLELCIHEVGCINTGYPAIKMFTKLKQLKEDWERFSQNKVAPEPDLKTSMKGILSEGVEKAEQKPKKSRRSLKLSKEAPNSMSEVLVDTPAQPEKVKSGPLVLWTDKYSPSSCAEVLGNSPVMKKLLTWLTEWKRLLDRERKKACKLMMKKAKGKGAVADSDVDDSDFDLDSDDSEDDDSICNTMLLLGPHGCGKTSSVYALAQELSFKVHEVNASSSRNGKHLLCQLQEATQSHQVSSGGANTPSKIAAKLKASGKPDIPNLPTAFTNLFKKTEPKKETTEKNDKGNKRKRNKSDKDMSPDTKRLKIQPLAPVLTDSDSNMAASLNLSSTTLILFDEVDVIFKEDTGFLSAVQTFMATTKIPIILTSADPTFTSRFDGKYEQVLFRRPSVASLTSHLQTISLLEGVRTDPAVLSDMVQVYNRDVRRSLVTLQSLIQSGGSLVRASRLLTKPAIRTASPQTVLAQLLPQSHPGVETTNSNDPDDNDFVVLKPLRKRRRILEEDSNSMDAELFKGVKLETAANSVDKEMLEKCPQVHQLGLEPFLASCTTDRETLLQQLLRCLSMQSSVSLEEMVQLCKVVHLSTRTSVISNNVHILCPLQHTIIDSVMRPNFNAASAINSKKRKRIRDDLYDSEDSSSNSNPAMFMDPQQPTSAQKDPISTDNTQGPDKTQAKKSDTLLISSLAAFSNFYDSLSELDQIESKLRMSTVHKLEKHGCDYTRSHLLPGLLSDLSAVQSDFQMNEDECSSYMSEVEVRSMCQLHSRLLDVKTQAGQETDAALLDQLVLPVPRDMEHLQLADHFTHSMLDGPQKLYASVHASLPDNLHCSHRLVHMDYLPSLREICRTEQARQTCNTKRRFQHYFDSIGLPIKDKNIGIMATTFM